MDSEKLTNLTPFQSLLLTEKTSDVLVENEYDETTVENRSLLFQISHSSMLTLPFSAGPPPPLGSTHELYAFVTFGTRDRWAPHHSHKRSSASRCEDCKLPSWTFALDIHL